MQPLLWDISQHRQAPPEKLFVCYLIFTVFFFKKRVKEHTGAGGSAPALPPGSGDAPPAAPELPAGLRCFLPPCLAQQCSRGAPRSLEDASMPIPC